MNEIEKVRQILTQKAKNVSRLKSEVERSLKRTPEGSLVISSSNGTVQYFHKTSNSKGKGKYIGKTNEKLIAALAQKGYDELLYRIIKKQEKQLNKALNLYKKVTVIKITHFSKSNKFRSVPSQDITCKSHYYFDKIQIKTIIARRRLL